MNDKPTENTSESAFQKALEAENAGKPAVSERWLEIAVKRDKTERGLPA